MSQMQGELNTFLHNSHFLSTLPTSGIPIKHLSVLLQSNHWIIKTTSRSSAPITKGETSEFVIKPRL